MKKHSKKAILYRLDALEQQVAVLDGRLDAERQARLDQLTKSFEAWKKQRDALDELVKKTYELDDGRRFGVLDSGEMLAAADKRLAALEKAHATEARNAAGLLETIKIVSQEVAKEEAELRARIEDLEDWMLAAKKGCSALRSIPFPKPKDGSGIDPHAVKAAGVSK